MNQNAASASSHLDLSFDAVDLINRTGAHRHIQREARAPAEGTIGSLAMTVPAGSAITVDAELESVVEGIYVGGTAAASVVGECSRCLDPVEQELTVRMDELFSYPEKVPADERGDVALLEDDAVDLGPTVHDALAVAADDRPLCRPDCLGLCPQCGMRMEEDPEHAHEVIDPRWAALQGLLEENVGNAGGAPEDPAPAERA